MGAEWNAGVCGWVPDDALVITGLRGCDIRGIDPHRDEQVERGRVGEVIDLECLRAAKFPIERIDGGTKMVILDFIFVRVVGIIDDLD